MEHCHREGNSAPWPPRATRWLRRSCIGFESETMRAFQIKCVRYRDGRDDAHSCWTKGFESVRPFGQGGLSSITRRPPTYVAARSRRSALSAYVGGHRRIRAN